MNTQFQFGYIGYKRCGCLVAASVRDDPETEREFLADGYRVERKPRAEVIAAFQQANECPHGNAPWMCMWTEDEHHGKHDTACGKSFAFIDDGPTENSFRFCPYCGGQIQQNKEWYE